MNRTHLLTVLLGVLVTVSSRAADESLAPITSVPRGDFAVARLELSSGLAGTPQQLLVAMRDGRLANLWFVAPVGGDQRINVERSTLTLSTRGLQGTVHLRTAAGRERPILAGQLTLDLTMAGERLAGTYELEMGQSPYKSSKGTASGSLCLAAPAADKLSTEAVWPSFAGPNGDMSTQPQPPLIGDLARARPVWRSETHVPTGYGNAPDSRYFVRAIITGNGGGGGSPVVAAGTVYMSFYAPNEQMPAVTKNPYWERVFPDEAAFRKRMTELNANEQEANWVLGHFRPVADDHVVAMDGATGATRWRTVLPRRSPNLQTHKHRGSSGVPLVAGDAIYVPNLSARLYALDVATGAVRWEFPAFDGKLPDSNNLGGPPNPSPLLIGDRLIWARAGMLYALDPATGRELWKSPGGYFLRWRNAGQERLVTFVGTTLLCLDTTTGQPLWKHETDLAVHAPLSAVVAGDVLIATPPADKATGTYRFRGLRLADAGAREIWQATPFLFDENMPVTVVDGRAYLLGRQTIHAIDVATGKTVAEKKFAEQGPGSNAWLGVVGERFLFLPEGQHGTARLAFIDRNLNRLSDLWTPTNTDTTAYNSQPVVYPVVDGRLFVRGGDGIYCYDLRK